jgi:hypothetical protein
VKITLTKYTECMFAAEEAAALLRYPLRKVQALCRSDDIWALKLKGRWVVPLNSIVFYAWAVGMSLDRGEVADLIVSKCSPEYIEACELGLETDYANRVVYGDETWEEVRNSPARYPGDREGWGRGPDAAS